jgi:SsrA-binding protein
MAPYSTNRNALFDYEILEKFEAGIVLTGFETKAVRQGKMNLSSGHVIIRGNEAWLLNTDIGAYQPENAPPNFIPDRTKKLLLKREEIKNLIGRTSEKGLTIIPLGVYTKANRIKLEIGLAKKRKKEDKREVIKEREVKKEIARTLKR